MIKSHSSQSAVKEQTHVKSFEVRRRAVLHIGDGGGGGSNSKPCATAAVTAVPSNKQEDRMNERRRPG